MEHNHKEIADCKKGLHMHIQLHEILDFSFHYEKIIFFYLRMRKYMPCDMPQANQFKLHEIGFLKNKSSCSSLFILM